MSPNVRLLFWIEAALAVLCGGLAVLTIFWQDWIEALTGYDPDQHDGSVEWLIVIALFAICAVLALLAIRIAPPRPAIAKPSNRRLQALAPSRKLEMAKPPKKACRRCRRRSDRPPDYSARRCSNC